MQVTTSCPHCDTRFQVASTVIGKRTRCTKCGQPFVLAEAEPVTTAIPPAQQLQIGGEVEPADNQVLSPRLPPPPPLASPNINFAESSYYEAAKRGDESANRSPARTRNRFVALRILAGIFDVMAVLTLLAVIVSITIDCIQYAATTDSLQRAQLIRDIVQVAIGSTLTILFLCVISNTIRLALQVERNTFHSQELLRRLCASSVNVDRPNSSNN